MRPGQRIDAGATLRALEGMKLETHMTAEPDAEAALVAPGEQVQAKELLVVLRAPTSEQ